MGKTILLILTSLLLGCNSNQDKMVNTIFLHHSTGHSIWLGKTNRYVNRLTGKNDITSYFRKFNKVNRTNYEIKEQNFPAEAPYGWRNNPFDYYNIWVKNAGNNHYMGEPTLEILTREFDIIIFKHCYPVSKILEDKESSDIESSDRRIGNYKLQYAALKDKMHEFPNTKFIVWTPAVHVKSNLTVDEAQRTQEFYYWIINEWDEKGDNIFIWDFYQYETEGELYLKDDYAVSQNNSHPNRKFSARIAPLFAQFIIDVAENKVQ